MHIVTIPQIVPEDDVNALTAALAGAAFVSGKATALPAAKRIKNNLQLRPESDVARRGAHALLRLLEASAPFQAATLPVAATTPRFCRYDPGMGYGDHRDVPVMEERAPIRTDIAVTISLTGAGLYDGGDLVIESDGAAHRWKGNAGDCVVYPANTRHRVETVTSGVRLVAIMWIQSAVRDPSKRRILFDMATAVADLSRKCPEASEQARRLTDCHANLLRLWAET
ncbi:MAG: Fe2+-dependent dioxygenase [Polyangiaceae bacterium]|nr:Fe2+-dependent dioxygenase [Polyangiaceae bacterium]